ncbi:MAG TPA: hypothetical protein VF507_07065 [Pyrinomonadaceae bacterium]|jgi:hypothetical protein
MSELREPLWAVLSERGCEATRITYDEASHLVQRLAREKVNGLCIISAEAAARAESERQPPAAPQQSAPTSTQPASAKRR